MDGHLHPGYAMNWNTSVQYQLSTNNIFKFTYQGSAGVDLVESWNNNVFPTSFGANNPALRAAAFAAPQNYLPYPSVRRHQLHVEHRALHLSLREPSSSRNATRKVWC